MLNKVDTLTDRTTIDVLRAHHENVITVSAITGQGLPRLTDMVAERLSDGFVDAEVETSVGNGKLMAYLASHAEVTNTDYNDDDRAVIHCRIPRSLLHKIDGDDTTVRLHSSLKEAPLL